MHVPCLLAAATIRVQRLFRSRALDCVATIRGRRLFEGGVYSKKYGSSFFCQPTPWELAVPCQPLDAHEQVICLHAILCYHDKSTDGVTFSIKLGIRMYGSMLIVCGSHGIPR